jgi:gluconate:H+ symporter, GntP family
MDARITDSTLIALGGLIAVVALLFLLITKFRWHVFIAMLVPILLFALVPGIDHAVFITAFETGFGSTVRSVAVVIVVGIVLAEGLKHTGAVERITIALIRWVGEKRMSLALTLSGWVIGIPIFSDVGYVILNPLVHSAAIRSEVNMATMSTGLIGGMQLTHAMVPPTPGPLAAVALLKADMGSVIMWGCFVSIIASFFGWLYALAVGPRLPSPPSTEFIGQSFVDGGREAELPTTFWAFAQSTATMLLPKGHIVNRAMLYLGWPVVALSIGVLIAYRNTKHDQAQARVSDWIENALRTSAMIIMVVGLGGALSQILRQTPAVDAIAKAMEATGLPAIFLPFVLGIVGNMITGSTTVGVITSASIVAPMMPALGLSPEATMLAASAGGIITKYVNSSYFWVCTSLTRMPLRSALISFGGVMIVNGVVSMAVIYILWSLRII